MGLSTDVQLLLQNAMNQAIRSHEGYELGGLEGDMPDPYDTLLGELDKLPRLVAAMRAEVVRLKTHPHDWNADSYCRICGADGRA